MYARIERRPHCDDRVASAVRNVVLSLQLLEAACEDFEEVAEDFAGAECAGDEADCYCTCAPCLIAMHRRDVLTVANVASMFGSLMDGNLTPYGRYSLAAKLLGKYRLPGARQFARAVVALLEADEEPLIDEGIDDENDAAYDRLAAKDGGEDEADAPAIAVA
jgi:hypothetical protein